MDFSNLDPRYKNLQLVGRGGFGVVYRAHDVRLDRDVAIKFLNPDLASDPTWRNRFRQEATAASQLNHPNITIVFDRNDDEHQSYIVMEFVDGKPLSKIIEEGTSLTVPERLLLLEQLCAGLLYAHQRQIVHRDIKPVNLMVREEHDGTHMVRTLKILDFGIAKMVNTSQTMTAGPFAFTANYVSPEQVLGFDADQRSDIFAVGAVAYELIVLRKAFNINAKSTFQILEEVRRKIVDEPHRPMTEVQPDVDPELVAIVDRALAKDPNVRYRDLGEMRRKVRAVRERMEQALESSSGQQTLILDPRPHQAIRRARQLLTADDPQGAVTVLEDALTFATNPSLRVVVDELLLQAREQARVKRARDLESARAATAAAIAAFREGDAAAAVQELESFEPRSLVADELAQLQRAAVVVSETARAVSEGPRPVRDKALRALEAFEPRDLVAPTLQNLRSAAAARDEAERQKERAAVEAAAATMSAARELFRTGARAEAIRALEQFAEPRRVVQELNQQRRAAQEIDRASAAVRAGDRGARAKALADLAAFPDRDLIDSALGGLQTIDVERQAGEDHEIAAAALVQSAREQFDGGDRAGAIGRLEAFTPVHAAVSDALATLRTRAAELERAEQEQQAAHELIQSARTDFRAGRRAPAIASLELHQDWPLVPNALAALNRAESALARAERETAAGDAAARSAALDALARFQPADLVAAAVPELRRRAAERDEDERQIAQARARAELEERANEVVRNARDAFAAGRSDEALERLHGFPDRELVADALTELERLAALIGQIHERLRTGSADERRAALDELAAATPIELLESGLAAARTLDAERTAEERQEEEDARASKAVADATAVFDEGQHAEAIAQLEAYAPASPRIVAALSTLRDRRTQIKAERERAALVREAEATEARAREEFTAGHVEKAIKLLSAFRDPVLVAGALDLLRGAAHEIDVARASVTTGAATIRRGAIDRVAGLAPPELFQAALAELRRIDGLRGAEERRQEAQRLASEASRLTKSARAQFLNGQEEAAVQALERFQPAGLVEAALGELRAAHDAIRRARQLLETGDDDTRQQAIKTLRGFNPADLVAPWVERLHEDHLRRRAAEAQARMEQELRERAERTADEARQAFDAGQTEDALARLEHFEPPHALVTELLSELRLTLDIRDLVAHAEQSLADGRLAEARAAIDQARAKRPGDSVSDDLFERIHARQREARVRRAQYVAVRFVAPGVIGVAIIVAAYQLWHRPGETPISKPSPQPHPSTTTVPVPVAQKPDQVVAEIKSLAEGGRLLEAAQRIEQVPGWAESTAIQDVAKDVLGQAEEHMAAVEKDATQRGADKEASFAQAVESESQGRAQAKSQRVVEAVKSYSKAEQLFGQAIQFHAVEVAATTAVRKAIAERRLSDAADLIVQGLGKPQLASAMFPLVREVLARAQQVLNTAKKQALDASSYQQQAFKAAQGLETAAQGMNSPQQVAEAVKNYQQAATLYGEAAAAQQRLVLRREQQVQRLMKEVQDLIGAGKLAEAAAAIVHASPDVQGDARVPPLAQAVTSKAQQNMAAAKKAASDAKASKQTAFIDAAGREHAASELSQLDQVVQAVEAYDDLTKLYQEAIRQKGSGPPPPPPPDAADAEKTAIAQLLAEYIHAYERVDQDGVRRIDPGFRGFSAQERQLLKSVKLKVTDVEISVAPGGSAARLTATQNFTYEWKRPGFPPTGSGTIRWSLVKNGGRWTVQ